MAKYLADELELQSIANAIRAKGDTSESLAFPTDFVSAIANIPSGGNIEEDGNGNLTFSTDGDVVGKIPLAVSANGTYTPPGGKAYSAVEVNIGGNKPSKNVNFRDYDGTIVNSYTKEEFLALTAMPANPSHDGLTAQGWNWSLADAKTYVTKYGRLEAGEMYITDDGKTHVYIHLEQGRTSPMLGCCPNGSVDVDWGDGTVHDTLTGTSTSEVKWTPNHNYAAPGDYVIKLTVTGSIKLYGISSTNQYSGLLRYSSSGDGRNYAYRNAIKKVEIGNGVTGIGNYAFYSCCCLASITISKSVTDIGSNAFQDCYCLASITIPDNVVSIGGYAFYNCYHLASITIPDGITSVGTYTFYFCYNLSSITIPDSVTRIDTNAFGYCYSLSSIIIPDSVTSIDTNAFCYCYGLTDITIPNSVMSIGNYMFYYCYCLTSIIIPENVMSIGSNMFYNCCSLASITIPENVTSVDSNAFQNCYSLSDVTIPESVTSIGNYAFSNCSSLLSVTIPIDVTSIGNYAFGNCYSIAEYHLAPTTPPTLASTNAFNNIAADCIIYVPYSSDHSILEAYKTATNWSTYASYM